jgi:hypothetical protein
MGMQGCIEKINTPRMPINHNEITTYTDQHIRRQIIVIQYFLGELMLTRTGRSRCSGGSVQK